jgi:hypothetical protein
MHRILIVFALSACSAQGIVDRALADVDSAAPEAYRAGYESGCRSSVMARTAGQPRDARVRDDARMKSDADYALGWNDGYRRCDVGPDTILFVR